MKYIFRFGILFATFLAMQTAAFGFQKALEFAPEFKKNRGWLNTEKPVMLSALRGKIVLLDFWTYGCINCLHVLPDIKKLEAKYKNELVVIGIHSAKFTNEGETENIRRVILRYEIDHPVVNDADFNIWNSYRVQGYPTFILINPNGEIVYRSFGEGQRKLLDEKIADIAAAFRASGKLDEKPLRFVLEKDKFANSPLLFPGKILADSAGDRLFIADTNHHRIVVTKLDGTLLEIIGNGTPDRTDGDFDAATFNRPQGLALDGDFLYVADTANQLIRRINLRKKKVETIAGTGQQIYNFQIGGTARKIPLNSPWDLQVIGGDKLFIAMAGNHQIWVLDLTADTLVPFAGSGIEKRGDGDLGKSAFAQPSGLASDGENLYVADAESNIIRAINLNKRTVRTLAGGNLFEFGDLDGAGNAVRLQHPLGVAVWGRKVLVADTYNHRIKILDPVTGAVTNFAGDGKYGARDGENPRFYEPGGISITNDNLFIADTNNHAVRVLNLKTKRVSTLEINGLLPPTVNKPAADNFNR